MLQMVRNKKHFYLRDRDIEQLRKASEKKTVRFIEFRITRTLKQGVSLDHFTEFQIRTGLQKSDVDPTLPIDAFSLGKLPSSSRLAGQLRPSSNPYQFFFAYPEKTQTGNSTSILSPAAPTPGPFIVGPPCFSYERENVLPLHSLYLLSI